MRGGDRRRGAGKGSKVSCARLALYIALPLGAGWLVALNLDVFEPLAVEPLREIESSHPRESSAERLNLARTYAPWIYHEVHPIKGRQDLPSRIDFDGEPASGIHKWETFPRFALAPAIYYAVLETQSHFFLTYHIYHPRDWEHVRLGLHLTHENDGENCQVVVEKTSGHVVLLFTQAHFRGGVYTNDGSGFADGEREIRGPFLLLDDAGRPDPKGRHVGVFVEGFGHGIYGVLDDTADVVIDSEGNPSFDRHGLVFRPSQAGDFVAEPALDANEPVPYDLISTHVALWPGLRDGNYVGDGRLWDGTKRLVTPEIEIDVPRFYEADRFSGPLGPDKGISPFAVDFGFGGGDVGALFFDPARRYAEVLQVPHDWSLEYVDYPFR